jgi:hypothetical protein
VGEKREVEENGGEDREGKETDRCTLTVGQRIARIGNERLGMNSLGIDGCINIVRRCLYTESYGCIAHSG